MTTIDPTRSPRTVSAVFWALMSRVRVTSLPGVAGFSAMVWVMVPSGEIVASGAAPFAGQHLVELALQAEGAGLVARAVALGRQLLELLLADLRHVAEDVGR